MDEYAEKQSNFGGAPYMVEEVFQRNLFKIIEEGCDALKGWLALSFYFYLELDFRLTDATQVLDSMKGGD